MYATSNIVQIFFDLLPLPDLDKLDEFYILGLLARFTSSSYL
nr:MAG TPA: hypothetical protein [Caudoviricetes sp.]